MFPPSGTDYSGRETRLSEGTLSFLSEGALPLKVFNPEQQSVSYSDRRACFPPVDRVEEGNRWVLASNVEVKRQCLVGG